MTSEPVARWVKREPIRGAYLSNAWTRAIPAALIREMRLNPGDTYQLLNKDGSPRVFSKREAGAIQNAARGSQFRAITRRVGDGSTDLFMWVSFDPAYVEELEARREKAANQ